MLGLKEAADKLERANGIRWYGHVLRQPEENVLMKAMVHEVDGKRKHGRPKMKWREQVKGNTRRIGLKKEDAVDRCRWRENVEKSCGSSKMHPATSIHWEDLNWIKIRLLLLSSSNSLIFKQFCSM